MTDEKRRKIREAALLVFLRYGFRRATMDDIAREVGVSRPALYLVFPSKEAVFRHVVEVGLDEVLQEIEAGLRDQGSLVARLRHVFEIHSVRSFELVARSPAADELMGASFDFVSDVFERYSRRLADVLADIIRGAVAEPDALEPPAEVRARIMIAAAHGFKTAARDAGDMRTLVHDLIRMTVAGLPVAAEAAESPRRSRRRKTTRRKE